MTDLVIRESRDRHALAELIGEAPAFKKIVAAIPAIARHDVSVLITGETGTGKELVARAIHYLSSRADRPFVCINCGSLPDSLAENTLFGHEAGAFTDAQRRTTGLMAEADGGTLFLDEVGELGARAQATLLRVLQDGTFHPLGSTRPRHTDARIVAATNAPLDRLVQSAAFRSDLYYRLRVCPIDLPPLRDRKPDILVLASHFLRKHAPASCQPLDLDEGSREALVAHSWPGNVRELENVVRRAMVVCQTGVITVEDLGIPDGRVTRADATTRDAISRPYSFQDMKRDMVAAFERNYLTGLMTRHRGNVTHAARTAGKDRRELGKLLKKHRLDARAFRI